jgi:hypothetical protein
MTRPIKNWPEKMTAQPKKLDFATEKRFVDVPEGGRHLVR